MQREAAWQVFANTVGYKELAKLDAANITYRLPIPGAIIKEGKLHANSSFPGLTIEYSKDGKKWVEYNKQKQPKVKAGVLVRTIAPSGRAGRAVTVE